jgi:RND superfamily putative drug exporter
VASAGSLYLMTKLTPVSIWAMNFALMFAPALGIDYALFIVHRFRGALFGRHRDVRDAVSETMDTAGQAVLFSGLTVLISLSAVMLVDSPAFRSMALGIMLSVIFILAATLTLLPAVLGKLGTRVDKLALSWVHSGEHRSPRFAAWGERLWRRPWMPGLATVGLLGALAIPVLSLDTGMPSIKVVPKRDTSRQGYELVQRAFGPGAPGSLQVTAPVADAQRVSARLAKDPLVAAVMPPQTGRSGDVALLQAIPTTDPSDQRLGTAIDRLRAELPTGTLVGGALSENHDLETELAAKTPLVIGVVLAPLIAAVGVVTNLLASGAAFGVRRRGRRAPRAAVARPRTAAPDRSRGVVSPASPAAPPSRHPLRPLEASSGGRSHVSSSLWSRA